MLVLACVALVVAIGVALFWGVLFGVGAVPAIVIGVSALVSFVTTLHVLDRRGSS